MWSGVHVESGRGVARALQTPIYLTLNCVPNQNCTTVSLLTWHQTYRADMIRDVISMYIVNRRPAI